MDAPENLQPYASPQPAPNQFGQVPPPVPTKQHSGFGIASFALSILVGFGAFAMVVVAGVMEVNTPGGIDEESGIAIAIGLSLFAIVGLSVLGFALGLVGIFQRNTNNIFPILGMLFNALVVMGLMGLLVLGATMAA